MPVEERDGRLHGPGTLDMKGGLTLIVFALRTLRDLGLEAPLTPVVFMNSDEEIGSPDSKRYVRMLARRARRAFVLEPSLGPDARLKTERKGLGRFEVTIEGRASHAGLDPGAGASAILELAHVIQRLHALNDAERGTTVNVGVIDGGVRPNVVAPLARASVDARVRTLDDARDLERAVAAIEPATPGVRLRIEGGIRVPPLERTPRNVELWERARSLGRELGLDLEEGMAGGGSDGNTTSQFTATLDGLGCVGDGAHAVHEHVEIDRTIDRCALLARLLLAPGAGTRG
jgi:glutamate carboxypeptidase